MKKKKKEESKKDNPDRVFIPGLFGGGRIKSAVKKEAAEEKAEKK
jgi:hypothetical protein